MVVLLHWCICILFTTSLVSSQSVEFWGNITIDSVSSQPEVYNTSFRDVISVKISQEAVITYSFLANATVNDGSRFNHSMSLTISAGSHLLVKEDCKIYYISPISEEEKLDCIKYNDSVLLVDLQRFGNLSHFIIYGKYNVVADNSVPGPVRSFLSLKPLGEATKEMKGLSIFSEVALQTWPGFSISSPVPDILHLKNTTTVAVNVTDLSGSLADSYLKMYMPTTCENCKELEAQMSAVRVDLEHPSDISGKAIYLSETRTTENDAAIYLFDEANEEDSSKSLQFNAISKLQDYRSFRSGDILEQVYGLKFKDEFIWIGKTNMTVFDDQNQNIPFLEMSMFEYSNYEKFGEVSKKICIYLDHSSNSTGSAYDIMAILYFPPDVGFVKYSQYLQNIIKTPEKSIDIDGKTVKFNIPRMAFVHWSRIYFNVSYTINGSRQDGQRFMSILYEVVYKGWNDTDDRSSELRALTIVNGEPTKEETRYCPCPWNKKQKCACCKPGWCLCSVSKNPDMCGPCKSPCVCYSEIPGYRRPSTLSYGGTAISCGEIEPLQSYLKYRAISCQITQKGKRAMDLPPLVSTILGVDTKSNYLYGVGNNGKGYVQSEDEGQTWASIPQNVFDNAQRSSSFKKALLK